MEVFKYFRRRREAKRQQELQETQRILDACRLRTIELFNEALSIADRADQDLIQEIKDIYLKDIKENKYLEDQKDKS